uniref:Uncharacterized protein n=1 Tax=Ditylenchus dipsaci TaxID=166011 RepID=A0A915D777_9BILA
MENGLQQRSSYLIPNLFPGGPRQVNAAFTNRRSGVTMVKLSCLYVLTCVYRCIHLALAYKTVYRYKWDKRHKRFYLAVNSPQVLGPKVDFLPTLAFQWKDGNLILANNDFFVTYNPFLNLVNFKGKIKDHFPNMPRDAIGLTYGASAGNKTKRGDPANFTTFLLMTAHHGLQIYDLKKYKIVQQYPIEVKEYVACLASVQNIHKDDKKGNRRKKQSDSAL